MDDLMQDRELLELSAKAVKLPECGWMGPAFMYVKDNTFTGWNPLTDDGDAFRLAVDLSIAPACGDEYASIYCPDIEPMWCIENKVKVVDGDRYSATRRAIVRAAAEIGQSLD